MPVCVNTDYCVVNTGYDFDGNYTKSGGTYNGYDVYYNASYYIYFSSTYNQWCLSSTIEGTCLMSGKYPCTSSCPDLCEDNLIPTLCPTPTPTPTLNCDVFNFDAIFDCLVSPTPSNTPTNTPTPTQTPTPSSTNPCPFIDVDATLNSYSPTPTPTPTVTPTVSPEVIRNCDFSGDVKFNVVDAVIKCPTSLEFQDCINGALYYTSQNLTTPSGGSLIKYMVFNAKVDNNDRCISYMGSVDEVSGGNDIQITGGPYGYSNAGGCATCVIPTPTNTPTPTVTPTPSITPTNTPTPTKTQSVIVFQSTTTTTIPGPSNSGFNVFVSIDNQTTPFLGTVWYANIPLSSYPNINLLQNNSNLNWVQLSSAVFNICSSNTFVGTVPYLSSPQYYMVLQIRDTNNTVIYKGTEGFVGGSSDPCINQYLTPAYNFAILIGAFQQVNFRLKISSPIQTISV